MIEYRAYLHKPLKFTGGFRLDAGTIVYVRATPHGWIGRYYESKGASHGFALDIDAFSILTDDIGVEQLVVVPDPPESEEEIAAQAEMQRRRIQHRIERHREAVNELEQLLPELTAIEER